MLNINSTIKLNDETHLPMVGFGTYQCQVGTETENAVRWALKYGYRHIDTAEGYRNETNVGNAIKESGIPREKIFLTTKVFPGRPPSGKTYQDVIDACNSSLKKLQVDYVDLYLIHAPLDAEHRIEQWKALETLKREGKALSIGVSNYGIHHLEELFNSGECTIVPSVNQVEISPFGLRKDLVDYCKKKGIQIVAYSSLTRGLRLKDSSLMNIAQVYNVDTATLLLRWGIQKGYGILPKSTHEERIKANINLFGFEISESDMQLMELLNEDLAIAWEKDPTQLA